MKIARYLDHAVLKPELTRQEAEEAIKLGISYEVRTVCVRPCDLELAVALCQGTQTEVSVVLNFPHGCSSTAIKAAEARDYSQKGARELDMVANYGWIRSGLYDLVEQDIRAVVEAAQPFNVTVKVILETSQLTLEQIARATQAAIAAGAAFVKTSTGFNGPGATEEAVDVMLKTSQGRIKVKPSGGIRDAARAAMFVKMGADRLGVNYTSTPEICKSAAGNP
ncbi:MAG: deoxyribose-phosphate aldolase [Planctomycetia bacterium]|nr:deoxyribose-phosphate aldolase [Planctomycetia bacterium]